MAASSDPMRPTDPKSAGASPARPAGPLATPMERAPDPGLEHVPIPKSRYTSPEFDQFMPKKQAMDSLFVEYQDVALHPDTNPSNSARYRFASAGAP